MKSGNRTNIGAAAALYTFVRIDLKMSVTQINCTLRALSLTSSTTDAIIANFISHFATLAFANFRGLHILALGMTWGCAVTLKMGHESELIEYIRS
jgi:hypothetical protein